MIFKDKYFFLSTFYPCDVTCDINNKVYKNVEAVFQAHKNPELADKFMLLSGLEAKKLGEKITPVDSNWNIEQLYCMAKILNNKFKNYGLLFQLKLIKEPIINDNFWGDTFWGVYKGEGKNMLGKMLQCIRDNNNDYTTLFMYVMELAKDV